MSGPVIGMVATFFVLIFLGMILAFASGPSSPVSICGPRGVQSVRLVGGDTYVVCRNGRVYNP
jgi:hypothetical protein